MTYLDAVRKGKEIIAKYTDTLHMTSNIYDSFFCLPVSQYLAIWNGGTIELWGCDPDVDGLLHNIKHAEAFYKRTGVLEEPPSLVPV